MVAWRIEDGFSPTTIIIIMILIIIITQMSRLLGQSVSPSGERGAGADVGSPAGGGL